MPLGRSRPKNRVDLKRRIREQRRKAAAVNGRLTGIEKKHSDFSAAIADAYAVVTAAVAHSQKLTEESRGIHKKARVKTKTKRKRITVERASRLEKLMRSHISSNSEILTKLTVMMDALKQEGATQNQIQAELIQARDSVRECMDGAITEINTIASEVAIARPNVRDTLSKPAAGDNPFILSSPFRLHSRPRDTEAAAIFSRRRGAHARRQVVPTIDDTSIKAIKGSTMSTKAIEGPKKK